MGEEGCPTIQVPPRWGTSSWRDGRPAIVSYTKNRTSTHLWKSRNILLNNFHFSIKTTYLRMFHSVIHNSHVALILKLIVVASLPTVYKCGETLESLYSL